MKITFDWLKDHLKTNLKEANLLEQLTNIGPEVESVESLSSENELFLDGSHNTDAAFQLNKTLQNLINKKDLIIILGMINTKDPKSYIAQFKNIKEIKTITIPNEESAISATTLSIDLQEMGIKVSTADNLDEAIQSISSDHPTARILICGSLYLAGQVLKNN